MLIEYHFKIQYTKGTENIKIDALNRKAKLQNSKKLLGAMLRQDKDKLIRYNYLKLAAINKLNRVYKILESFQAQRILKVQLKDLKVEQYLYREVIYILRILVKEFIKEFYKGII